jgi:hypothetical protein
MSPATTILFISADPTDEARLRLGQEIREIRERLQLSKYRDKFLLVERHCVRTADLTQAIFDVDPNIVHFSGHGASNGSIILEDQNGASRSVPAHALQALFALFSDRVWCVVLNACHSRTQAESIAESVRYVVGMDNSIGDLAAINFSIGFYRALGNHKSIEEAFEFGLTEMRLNDSGGYSTPKLLTNPRMQNRLVKAAQRIDRDGNTRHVQSPSMPGRAKITIPEGFNKPSPVALVKPNSYNTFEELLNELYIEYLVGKFRPYAYGQDWILTNGRVGQALAPILWVTTNCEPVRKINPGWLNASPSEIGMQAGSHWDLISLNEASRPGGFYGLATNDEGRFLRICRGPKEIYLERRNLRRVAIEDFDETYYSYKCVLGDWLSLDLAGTIIVDN